MIQQDTIQVLSDSISAIPDTLERLDSLSKMDSVIAMADSIKANVPLHRGFPGIPHPSLPQTEGWVFILLIALFFLLVYSISRSGGMIGETIKTFFQVKDRSSIFSKATVNDFRLRLLLIIFSGGVLSLYLYLVIFKPENPFSIRIYSYFLMITGLYLGLKSLLLDLLGYVFLSPSSLKMAKDGYFNILSVLGIILFPLLILQIYIPYTYYQIPGIISLIACLSACILVIIKLFQIFFHKTVATFYIMLYLCTLEILPLIILYWVYKLIV